MHLGWDGLYRVDGISLTIESDGIISVKIPMSTAPYNNGPCATEILGECSIREARDFVDRKYALPDWWKSALRRYQGD